MIVEYIKSKRSLDESCIRVDQINKIYLANPVIGNIFNIEFVLMNGLETWSYDTDEKRMLEYNRITDLLCMVNLTEVKK